MDFSFVILTWNRKNFLEKCLKSLEESIGELRGSSEIIVMDNGSDDETPQLLEKYKDRTDVRIIRLKRNFGLNAYKKLIGKATGKYIVVVDDDVLAFPKGITGIFESYFEAFPDFGYLALDVVQNEHTNGAKPTADFYSEIEKDGKVIQAGPTGGWCTGFRRRDFRKIRVLFNFRNLNMKSSEDGVLAGLFQKWLKLKCGIIKGHCCFHASGPYYSREFGYLDRDIEKYRDAGLDRFVEMYEEYRKA